ncbi:MAG: cytidine deaminase-like protein [Piptocephalis tieghemiana]|nr:MAG: cytidine deaminase-like protein [Piptocephalis tieghemiana]
MLITPDEQDPDVMYMKLAVEEAQKSEKTDSAYCVGALLVLPISGYNAEDSKTSPEPVRIIAAGYSRELPGNTHAEECALAKVNDIKEIKGATCYTTMEPCSKRLSGKDPCTDRLIQAGIKRVVIGATEPDHFVQCEGISLLEKAGVEVKLLKGLEELCLGPNNHILQAKKNDA